ncbi:MAG: triose-phosphate isomerase [Kofleriaceae bacterium]|nr:triose-phosphate isomerase [Myxococcales bacterium]MCB9560554.1 triose-phosphate isomerase [Kofleriaceae bacterium]MCB9573268.1 triose-phosphate isomerase [Kofleriaceae bacterium]
MRTPFVVGNWKLHKNVAEAQALVTELKNQLGAIRDVAVGVAPPFTALWPVARRLEDSHLVLAAQDCFWEEKGAWTGEVAPTMLADVGCTWTLVGHSERRTHFGETDATVGKKVAAALKAGLGVIACVGETEAQRDANQTFAVVDAHLDGALAGGAPPLDRFVIAYEPVWAIGTGRTATPAQAQEVHAHIRGRLRERLGDAAAAAIRIQYGGSVKAANAETLMRQPDIDGALVGGASLDAAEFVAIVKAARPRPA